MKDIEPPPFAKPNRQPCNSVQHLMAMKFDALVRFFIRIIFAFLLAAFVVSLGLFLVFGSLAEMFK